VFIGYNVRKWIWESSIKKAIESPKFNIFWFPYQWAAKGEMLRVYLLYLFEGLTLGWLLGLAFYLSEQRVVIILATGDGNIVNGTESNADKL